eukprot:3531027-Rhodomonas_salina.2
MSGADVGMRPGERGGEEEEEEGEQALSVRVAKNSCEEVSCYAIPTQCTVLTYYIMLCDSYTMSGA